LSDRRTLRSRVIAAGRKVRRLRSRVIDHARRGNRAPKLRRALARARRDYRAARVAYEAAKAARRRPRIVRLDVSVAGHFGPLGAVHSVTGHHTAGPKDTSDAHALSLYRQYHAQHARQGWGGIGYHFGITRNGTIVLLRPVGLKGAHVGGHNTGNVGVVCHGTTGDRPTPEQAAALRWLIANAHTSAMPASHRIDLRRAALRGHRDWSGHTSNACPGSHYRMYRSGGTSR
jgi:hypothetical protein